MTAEALKTKQIGDRWHVCDDAGVEFDGPYDCEWDAMIAIKSIAEPWKVWTRDEFISGVPA